MLGQKKLLDLINYALLQSKADQTEISIMNYASYLTRFANNYIHQNVGEENTNITIRTILGKRFGIATTNFLSRDKIKETIQNALAITRLQPENPDFRTLPFASKKDYKRVSTFYNSTARFSPDARAQAVKLVFKSAQEKGLNAYGSFTTGALEIGIGNSLGVMAYNLSSDAYCNVVMMGKTSSGYADAASRDVRDLDTLKIARTSIEKALLSQNPIDLPPGRYTVILEPLAVDEMMAFLGGLGFGAKVYQEGRSFLKDKLGKKIVDSRITWIDDAYNEKGFVCPFDFEGMPKKKIRLFERGVAKDLAYDSLTAFKEGKESTGHAMPQPSYIGPFPTNLVLKGGKSTFKEMIRSTKKGILVTRFHYTNTVDPMKTVITGMTRDGTFLIENGEITKGIKNLRFTQSILEALNNLVDISRNQTLAGGGAGYGGRFAVGSLVPALKIDNFNFTSATEF